MAPAAGGELDPLQAAALGLIQGPAELLPVSSSAHLNLVPWLAGWSWSEADPEARKSFEVAVHAGAAAALMIGQRRLIAGELRSFGARRAGLVALSFLPPPSSATCSSARSSAGSVGPRTIAAGLVAGSVAMVAADRAPQERGPGDATPLDGLFLGLGQAAALAPGVSRNGATLAAARWRRFTRPQANLLSRTVALPVIVGASVLKGTRLRRRGIEPGLRSAMAVGDRSLLRLDPGLAAADLAGRARPGAVALRGLQGRARRGGDQSAPCCTMTR